MIDCLGLMLENFGFVVNVKFLFRNKVKVLKLFKRLNYRMIQLLQVLDVFLNNNRDGF